MADEFIKYRKKTQTELLSELQRLHQKLYVRIPLSSEESKLVIQAMDIAKDIV
jgi:hypothetical protein